MCPVAVFVSSDSVCLQREQPCRANGLNCVSDWWGEGEATERGSESQQGGCRGRLSATAVALTACLKISEDIIVPNYKVQELFTSRVIHRTAKGEPTQQTEPEQLKMYFIVE